MNAGSRLMCGALIAALGAMAAFAQAADRPPVGDDEAAIRALESRFGDAFRGRDVAAIMRLYAPGADLFVFDVGPPRQHVGWDDYRKDWQDGFDAYPGPVGFTISDLSVTVVGTAAYGHSIQKVQYTRKDGSKFDVVVRVSDVYRKLHGRWLIVQEHVSVPVDLDAGIPDLMSKP
jgi:ketosteroid isomerase-like protein